MTTFSHKLNGRIFNASSHKQTAVHCRSSLLTRSINMTYCHVWRHVLQRLGNPYTVTYKHNDVPYTTSWDISHAACHDIVISKRLPDCISKHDIMKSIHHDIKITFTKMMKVPLCVVYIWIVCVYPCQMLSKCISLVFQWRFGILILIQ